MPVELPAPPLRRDLVPEVDVAPPTGTTLVDSRLTGGLPHRLPLADGLVLVLVVPTGHARAWRDLPPETVVTAGAWQLAPWQPEPRREGPPPVGERPRSVPARLVLLDDGAVCGSRALAVGSPSLLTTAADRRRAAVEVQVVGWLLHAGTLVGPGDHGSRLTLVWRRLGGSGGQP